MLTYACVGPPMDLYERWHSEVVVVQVWLVLEFPPGSAFPCTNETCTLLH